MPANQDFSGSYDSVAKGVTAVVCVIFLAIAIVTKDALVAAAEAVLTAVCFAWSPRGFAIEGRSIVVKRLIGSVGIPIDSIRELRTARAADFRNAIRLWASGGLFGYYGLFRTSTLGKSTWYVTNRDNGVVLITGDKTLVLSPDDVPGFLAAVRAVAPVPEAAAGPSLGSANSRSTGLWIAVAVGFVVTFAALGVVAVAVTYSPGPPKVTLTGDSLTISDRFYPVTLKSADVDLPDVRVVDITADQGWRPTLRTHGFANAHYSSGHFRVASGQNVLLFRAGGKRLVVLPIRSSVEPVLLEVTDPERFVDELKRSWSPHASPGRRCRPELQSA